MFLRKIQCTTLLAVLTIAPAGYSFAADTSSIKADVLKDVSDKSVDEAFKEFEAVLKQQDEAQTLNASNASSRSSSAVTGKAQISKDSGYYKSDDAFFAGVKKPERVFKNID